MSVYCAPPSNLRPLYFAEWNHGKLGNEFAALDRDTNSRTEIIREIRSRGIKPIKIIEVIEPCEDFPLGQVTDVTADLIAEAEQPREPRSHEELRQMLIDLQNDKRRDYLKHEGIFGW